MKHAQMSELEIVECLRGIDRAAADYDWPRVLELCSQVLEMTDLPPETAVDMLRHRACAYEYTGHINDAFKDLESAVALAEGASLFRRQIMAINYIADIKATVDIDGEGGLKAASTALLLAEQIQAVDLMAESHVYLSWALWRMGDLKKMQKYGHRALSLSQQCGSQLAQAGGLFSLGIAASWEGDKDRAADLYQQALGLFQQLGNRRRMCNVVFMIGALDIDIASYLYQMKQSYLLAKDINHIDWQLGIENNFAFVSWKLGLYHRALEAIQEVIQLEKKNRQTSSENYLLTLIECYIPLGQFDQISRILKQIDILSQKDNEPAAYSLFVSGLSAFHRNDFNQSTAHLEMAVTYAHLVSQDGFLPTALSWLAASELRLGKYSSALKHAGAAVEKIESGTLYSPQEIWWWWYQVKKATPNEDGKREVDLLASLIERPEEDPMPDDLFAILNRACSLMLDYLGNIGDEGLRRNYLNKVLINRDITLEWTKKAAARGDSLEPFTKRETKSTSFEEQFQRLVEIGNRLTVQRDPKTLPETIRNEFVELSGAERAIVALSAEDGSLTWVAHLGLDNDDAVGEAAFIEPYLTTAREFREPILRESEGNVPVGGVPELYLRSVLALPLVSQGRLWGVLYGDMRHIFGRFSQQDLSLLNLLANQAAAALENANWVQGLERKVDERTAELNARVSELAIINSVQGGLVAELDLQAIFDIVGDNLTEIFTEGDVSIFTYDAVNDKALSRYFMDEGRPISLPPLTPSPIWRYIDETRKPFLAKTRDDYPATMIGIPDTAPSKSGMHVPLIAGDRFIGAVNVQSSEENAYDDSDLRLLTTLANSMSVALENARLFHEAGVSREEAVEARQTAEDANKAKSTFLANMSHELRTPLNAIIGFTRIVKRKAQGNMPEKQIDNLGKVQSSAEHLLGLINTILDLAKIEAGGVDVHATQFEVRNLIDSCLATAQPLTRPGVIISAEIDPDLPSPILTRIRSNRFCLIC